MLLTENILGNPRSSGPSGSQRLLCFVMDRLALAVSCGLPVVPVLRALLAEPELARPGVRRAFWRHRLTLVLGDLEEGRTLSAAFERHLRRRLPAHFVPALRRAEEADRLREVFPLLVRNLSASTRAIQRLRGALAYPLVQLVVIWSIVSGLFIFIVPKFSHMMNEMIPGCVPGGLVVLQMLAGCLRHLGPWLVLGVPALIGLAVTRRCLAYTADGRRFIESVCESIPLAHHLLRRIGLVEAASAMAAFLAAGVDVGSAARAAADTVETRWARRRLRQFADAVSAGTPWADAWAALGVGSPLSEWMIRNAAAREQPRDGFQAVAEGAVDDLNRLYRTTFQWLEPVMIVLNGLIVGAIVYALAGCLFGILNAMVFVVRP